jgi:hypothetical protein
MNLSTLLKSGTPLLVATALLAGCQTTGDSAQTTAEGCIAGGVLGAVAGGLLGGGRGAAIGGAIGLAAGCGAGAIVAQRKAQYANLEDYYRAQSQIAEQVRVSLVQQVATLQKENHDRQLRIAELQKQVARGHHSVERIHQEQADLSKRITVVAQSRDAAKKELTAQQQIVAEAKSKQELTGQDLVAKETQVAALGDVVQQLDGQVNTMAAQNKSLSELPE